MKIGLDNTAAFPTYLEYQAKDIMKAFAGENSDFPSHSIRYQHIVNPLGKDRHNVITHESVQGLGLYMYYRLDALDPKRNFVYVGVTTEKGIKQRFSKICRHAKGNVHIGDTVLPLSRYLRDDCKGDVNDIRVCFIPMKESKAYMRQLEKCLIMKLKRSFPNNVVKNVTNGELMSNRPVADKYDVALPL